ncbi:tRNA(Ile)-lysidine synthase [Pusillimonas noertemannii]|uniref:tRNA(Ile)-lysidine synthase n=1 Tax=Pusillimonas noertemannii TaxID=305977 RepID=A0A2U1CLJ5_9BURK|nr:tRNA lysidine(34) synthetase TilS [Pusillimonas noertemannii]PVY61862.1 tRNA(Ile)-lysidine synthase [Pusillimonas noertemannii]TFL09789.1 tRNA lysidine(34) synthetase TilS [Pusillimonas noertemannii]
MAATKRPVPDSTSSGKKSGKPAGLPFGSPALLSAIDRALASLDPTPRAVGVAVSGGADSAMLAVHAAEVARQRGIALHFLHVHHGLQLIADDWRGQVHDLAQLLAVPCHSMRVQVDPAGDGIESAARTARYRALAALAERAGVGHVLLAHHQDDQAETVLLRLLRGAGPQGLGAMAPQMHRDGLVYLRPWLDVSRASILRLADEFRRVAGWKPVHDPTNAEDRYTRSAVRERLTPQLDDRWPGWQATLARHARQSREASQVLQEVATQDLAGLEPSQDGRSFSLARWRELSQARQALVLRHWLAAQGLRMPTDARLAELMRQMRGLHALGHDRQMQVKHGDALIRCVRGRVLVE